jgi:hypothetical protein
MREGQMAIFTGSKKKNVLNGTGDDDQLLGLGGHDQLFGHAGADVLVGGRHKDKIDGGSGIDTAVFSGKYDDYEISFQNNGTILVKGKDGKDTVVNVEILKFNDHDAIVVGGAGSEFTTIQSGVNAAGASDGDVVLVAAGTYVEQVTVANKVLTIQGQGDATKIVAPASLTANVQDTAPGTPSKNAMIGVNGGDVTIKDLSIDGLGHGNSLSTAFGAADFNGIFFLNASGEIEDVTITGIRDPLNLNGSLSGNQRGNGIVVANRDGVPREVEVSDTTVTDFQKTGMVFDGAGLTVDVHDNDVTGGGLQPLGSPAQNGIQVSRGATGTIDDNEVSDLGYGPDSFSATGILVFDSDNVVVTRNEVTMIGDSNDAGIAFVDADSPIAAHNEVTATFGIYQLGAFTTELSHHHNDLSDSAIAIGFYPDAGGPYQINGTQWNDDLWGAGGNDIINGGRGGDTMVGDGSHFGFGTGDGDDVFVFNKHSGDDTIYDFGQTVGNRDTMDVSAYHFHDFADLQDQISDNINGDAVIQLSADDSITVAGVASNQLTQNDFIV